MKTRFKQDKLLKQDQTHVSALDIGRVLYMVKLPLILLTLILVTIMFDREVRLFFPKKLIMPFISA